MEYMLWVWLGTFVLFVALELMSLGLTSIWFAVGALAACVAYLLSGSVIVQIIVFFVVTVLVLILIRPYAVKYINNKTEKTNVEAIIGKTAKVIHKVDNVEGKGTVLLDGMEWSARSAKDNVIEPEALVTVVAVEGVKVIVEKKK